MSPSDPGVETRIAAIAAELREVTASEGMPQGVVLRDLMTAATLLYGAAVRQRGREVSLADPALTPTDVVVLCCALLRAQDLNPFDLTLWFGRVAPDAESLAEDVFHHFPHAEVAGGAGFRSTRDPCAPFEADLRSAPQDEEESDLEGTSGSGSQRERP